MSDLVPADLLAALRGRIRFLAVNVIVVTLAALVLSLLLPKWYQARAVLLPPSDEDMGSSLTSLLPRGFGAMRIPGTPSPGDLYVAELRSRTVGDQLVDRFHLIARYKVKDRDKALKALADHSHFAVQDEGTISIQVEDRDPRVAADMANAYVEQLDRFNRETRTTAGKRTRQFIEKRLAVAKKDLADAEEALREYQQKHGVAALSPAARGEADVGAELMARKISLEVKLNVLRESLSESSEEVRRVREELAALNRQLGSMPKTGIEVMRLWRDVEVQEKVFELLTSQLEEARIQETRDTPTVQLLDAAVPPLHKSRPKRALIVLAGFAIGLLGSVGAALLLERRASGGPAGRVNGA
jgi:tyrosine-protein kinase Etk/Wzc